jgi:CRISPR-associated protein Csb2
MTGFALGIRYLTGYAVATDPARRDRAEWPPHPGRIFMALASAHFETGEEAGERTALEWLETLEPPILRVSDADPRTVVTHFVPVNDRGGPSKAPLQSAPEFTRDRAGRTFPRVRPHDETAYLIWPNITPDSVQRQALERLCASVIRVGHSSSLVQMWYAGELNGNGQTLAPTGGTSEVNLRIVSPGTLAYLRRQYNGEAVEAFARLSDAIASNRGTAQRSAKEEFKAVLGQDWKRSLSPPPSRRPVLSLWQGYHRVGAQPVPPPAATVFDPALVFLRLEPRDSRYERLGLVTTLQLTDVLRRAIQHVADQDLKMDTLPEVLTGHSANGTPSEKPHAAYFPLAFVGSPHATGNLMGLAVVLPRAEHWVEHRKERRPVMTVMARIKQLTLGRLGVWELVPELRETPPDNLRPKVWTASPEGARVWASVTPIAFDEHPKQTDRAEYLAAVAVMIRGACARIGLPEPPIVRITSVSAHVGAPTSRDFPRLRRKDGGERRHAHAIMEFAQPVVGPVLLGAGRYRGYGVCRPLHHVAEESV